MPDYMLAFVIAAGVALLITPGVIFLAATTGAMDAPDARKVHKKPIPRIGGLGIYAAFMVAMLSIMFVVPMSAEVTNELIGLMVGGSLIVLVGIIDDYKNLPAKVKLVGQILGNLQPEVALTRHVVVLLSTLEIREQDTGILHDVASSVFVINISHISHNAFPPKLCV